MSRKSSSQPSISRFFSSRSSDPGIPAEPEIIDLSEDEKSTVESTLSAFKFAKNINEDEVSQKDGKKTLQTPVKLPLRIKRTLLNEDSPQPRRKSLKSHFDQLTPLEQQFVTLKRKNTDKVLAIQVGYKFKFFGEDASKVHKILSIMLIPGKKSLDLDNPEEMQYDKFAYCSIPENRLHIHLKRLLDQGMKVGVVEQMESAAIKNQSSNKNSLFERKVTRIYTSGTYIDDDDFDSIFDKTGNFIVGVMETEMQITLVAVQLINGEIIFDKFEDDILRNELETRLLHLDPSEFLIIGELSPETTSCLESFKKSKKSTLRFTDLKANTYQTYLNEFSSFFDDLEFIMSLERSVQIVCFEMIIYLKEFNLDTIFNKTENYQSFNVRNFMILNNQTLKNLEIFQNSTNGEEKGSLLWLLDHTRTKCGFRLLKKWISRPLIHREEILERQDCIESLISNYNQRVIELFLIFLKNCPDMEKSLNRIHFRKCSMKEIYLILQKINELLVIIKSYKVEELSGFSHSLKELFTDFQIFAENLCEFESYLNMINSHVIKDDHMESRQQKMNYFNSKFFDFDDLQYEKDRIENVKKDFDDELVKIRSFLRRPQLNYTSNNKEDYLIEVRNTEVSKVPSDWLKFNSTKSVSRFFTPGVLKLIEKFKYHEEILLNKVDEKFKVFLSRIDSHYSHLNKIFKNLSKLDCLLSLAAISTDFTKPVLRDKPFIELKDARNPILEILNPNRTTISNDITMSEEDSRVLIITGPNMGGKSSLIKQIAITVIMAQIGCFIPVRYGCLGIFNKIFIRMGSSDNIFKGESTFQMEMMESLNILKQSDEKSLILLDEIGRGTSTNDGFAIAYSILNYFISETNSFVLFITHFNKLISFENKFGIVKNYHMGYLIEGEDLTFLYKFTRGGCSKSYGINVARLTSIPKGIVDIAERISKDYEDSLALKMISNWTFKARDLMQVITTNQTNVNIKDLLNELLEQL